LASARHLTRRFKKQQRPAHAGFCCFYFPRGISANYLTYCGTPCDELGRSLCCAGIRRRQWATFTASAAFEIKIGNVTAWRLFTRAWAWRR
jgi:hypothetical protein